MWRPEPAAAFPTSLGGLPRRSRCPISWAQVLFGISTAGGLCTMEFGFTQEQDSIRESVAKLCAGFPQTYWRDVDERRAYPEAFVQALTDAGWLGVLVPEEYGGGGATISDAALILE